VFALFCGSYLLSVSFIGLLCTNFFSNDCTVDLR
jgi:hypothetical protein